ncbi:Camelysin metallo-endopeptidase [Modestobacter sp. DSM 44400]|uniref:TasA family protein n=1 Tax=Modestobacter sp. DSM 44400 TaxID=1550230 RepID=UPI00089B3415|nr:TasA family protein [Modestobacter sp. DSM 44400]SDY52764.1 Camelysin metallo-endopeptidase [Modestobacter sp. DSM 44400]
MTATATTRTRTARKLLGSLGIVGAAAAVAGMGTFGTFTDSTAPLNASVNTGTLSITLTPANDTAALSMSANNFVPGDSLARSVDLVNDGTSAFSGLSLASTASTSNLLSTDATNGLKLGVESCSVTWTKTTAANGAALYTCSGTKKTMLNTGPAVVTNGSLTTPASVTAGGVDHLVVTLSLPAAAGNEFQGLTNSLAITFSGTQASGTAR